MVRKFDVETLAFARSMPLLTVLDMLSAKFGFYWRRDRDFQPEKDKRTQRIYVAQGDKAWELLVTGFKWYDTRAKKGGGGGIDLVVHLVGLDFVAAVRLLNCSSSD